MKVKKIYIVTDASLPIGFASTNRILSYVDGFQKNGIDCDIIIFRKTENPLNIKNFKATGNINGTKYNYLFSSPIKSKSFFKRRIDNVLGLTRLILFAAQNFNNKVVVIYYSSHNRYAISLWLLKKIKNFLFLKEENEFPLVFRRSKTQLSWFFFKAIHYRLFDGYLLMTKSLGNYFHRKFPKIPFAHIPMTVNISRFSQINKYDEETAFKYITYVGSLKNEKDGVLLLAEAFSKIQYKGENLRLLICGNYNSEYEYKVLLATINELGIKDKTEIRINVDSDQIPQILNKSYILVLPRPDSLQAQNGFPTKLGEYLASGTPTLVTAVGEIPDYLEDGRNAYIAQPNDVESLAEKLKEIIDHYEKAKKIGLKGKDTAITYFNNVIQTKKIIDFVKQSF